MKKVRQLEFCGYLILLLAEIVKFEFGASELQFYLTMVTQLSVFCDLPVRQNQS